MLTLRPATASRRGGTLSVLYGTVYSTLSAAFGRCRRRQVDRSNLGPAGGTADGQTWPYQLQGAAPTPTAGSALRPRWRRLPTVGVSEKKNTRKKSFPTRVLRKIKGRDIRLAEFLLSSTAEINAPWFAFSLRPFYPVSRTRGVADGGGGGSRLAGVTTSALLETAGVNTRRNLNISVPFFLKRIFFCIFHQSFSK